MKSLFIFILGAFAGAAALHYYEKNRATAIASTAVEAPAKPVAAPAPAPAPSPEATPAPSSSPPTFADKARETAAATRQAISDKLTEWHLTPEEIKRDLASHGEVVRAKAKEAGRNVADATQNAKIKAFIKAKYAFDSELSARAIEVDCDQGHVVLRGTAPSETLIGKAVALALETEGVLDVKSLLVVKP